MADETVMVIVGLMIMLGTECSGEANRVIMPVFQQVVEVGRQDTQHQQQLECGHIEPTDPGRCGLCHGRKITSFSKSVAIAG